MAIKKRLLVANRGEIAIRILSTARELGLHTIAIHTDNDQSHASHAHDTVQIPSAVSFQDIGQIVRICKKHAVDLVHPGYGFLSESAQFAEALQAAKIGFVGPSPEVLRQTGDKLKARKLAEACGVPVLPALTIATNNPGQVAEFARNAGYPIMLKAVDGGGGRGIRLVNHERELDVAFQRAVSESPSKSVFAEKAAIGGFRHIEVQVLGDGQQVRHFWERECSIQRRYQKVIEMAPSLLSDRELVASVIECALRMAERIRYRSLGTWEFLVSPDKSVFFFMEINPRLQVEHTITETICGVDLVRFQLLIAQGQSLQDLILQSPCPGEPPPPSHAIQLRLTAEDPHHKFSLSIGRINSVSWPGGNGVRVDTHTRTGVIVSADFDSLLGKIIISSKDWLSTVDKCDRALEDTSVEGITTNLNLLRAIVLSEDFRAGECDTGWLEQNLARILGHDLKTRTPLTENATSLITTGIEPPRPMSSSGLLVKKGDTFAVHLVGPGIDKSFDETLTISKVVKNDFPNSLITELTGSKVPGARDNEAPRYTLQVAQSSGTTNSTGSRKGDPENPTHLICPLAGQLVEMLVEEGDVVEEWEPVAIMRQMKMELEVRAQRKGVVTSLWEIEEGDDVGDGMLVCVIMPEERLKEKL